MHLPYHWRRHSDPPRLQIFVSDLGATGVVRNAIAIANEAASSGYQVRLLTCSGAGLLSGTVAAGVAVVTLNAIADARRPRRLQMLKALLPYRRHSRSWRPDILLSAGNHGHLLSTLAWLGLPGAKILRFSNDLTHGTGSPILRCWRNARFWLMARLADRLIYVSTALGKHPFLARAMESGKAVVIPNGVDAVVVRRESGKPCNHPWIIDRSVPLVLAVGRHVRQKNFDTLLHAFARARAKRRLRLLFLGHGKPAEISRLSKLAADLGVGDDVAFEPAASNPFPYMAAASALALPSLWEGSANVLLEAMACGTPVVAACSAGDAAHVLGADRFGLLVDGFDVDSMASTLLRQTGPNPVRPGNRAASFSRRSAMNDYVRLFDNMAGRVRKSSDRERALKRWRVSASGSA